MQMFIKKMVAPFYATSVESNTASVMNDNISSFPGIIRTGDLYWKAFLSSDSTQDCELDELKISYD